MASSSSSSVQLQPPLLSPPPSKQVMEGAMQVVNSHLHARMPFAVMVRHRLDMRQVYDFIPKADITAELCRQFYDSRYMRMGVTASSNDDIFTMRMPLFHANHLSNDVVNGNFSDNVSLCFAHFVVPFYDSEKRTYHSIASAMKQNIGCRLKIDACIHLWGLQRQIHRTAMYDARLVPSRPDPVAVDNYTYYTILDPKTWSSAVKTSTPTACVVYDACEWFGSITDGDRDVEMGRAGYMGTEDKTSNLELDCRISVAFTRLLNDKRDSTTTTASVLKIDMKFRDLLCSKILRTDGVDAQEEHINGNSYWLMPFYFPDCCSAINKANQAYQFERNYSADV